LFYDAYWPPFAHCCLLSWPLFLHVSLLPYTVPNLLAESGKRTFMAARGTPAAMETMMVSFRICPFISFSTVPTYWGFTAMKMTSLFSATCQYGHRLGGLAVPFLRGHMLWDAEELQSGGSPLKGY